MVERTMDYVKNLVNIVCGQVDTFIKNVMRSQDIDNSVRTSQLGDVKIVGPKYHQTSEDNRTTRLVRVVEGGKIKNDINNNPLYPPNMIDRLNTPFDHIERILLQDFTKSDRSDGAQKLMDVEGANYFKSLFTFTYRASNSAQTTDYKNSYGVTKISMADANYPTGGSTTNTKFPAISYKTINDKFASGEYFIDSFTYSPFIDYSLAGEGGDSKVGIYADDFLTDYNYGRYEADYWGAGKKD